MNAPQPMFDEATRIAAGATRSRYDPVSVALHWLTVFLVLSLFLLSQIWGFTHRPLHHWLVVAHMSFGMMLGVTVVGRIIWRLVPGHQVEPAATGLTETLSRVVHWMLYALLIAQSAIGYIVRWAGGEPMSFFGLLILPPFTAWPRPAHHQITEIHEWIGWAIVILACGHAAAALYHHFVLHDRVLKRMLPRGAAKKAS